MPRVASPGATRGRNSSASRFFDELHARGRLEPRNLCWHGPQCGSLSSVSPIRRCPMSLVVAVPDFLGAAATDLARLGSTLNTASAAAAGQTIGVAAAAEDEVSAAIAALFSAHGKGFQSL